MALLLLALPAAAGTAVTVNGLVLKGDLRVEGEEVVLAKKTKEERRAKAEFLLVEADDGKLLFAPAFDARMRAYEYLAQAERASSCVKLVDAAIAARDAKLARRLLEMAQADGFLGKPADELKKKVEGLEGRPSTPDPKKAAQVETRIAEVSGLLPALLVARARADETDGLRLLREAFRLDAQNAAAEALLAEKAPKDFTLGPPRLWLDWTLDLSSQGAHPIGEKDLDLLLWRSRWRKDLYGLEAGQVRIQTPVTDTGTVGRCLSHGQLVCRALAETFKTDAPKLRSSKTLLVLLYPTKEEYLSESSRGDLREREYLRTTVGHYSMSEQVSRVIWDKDPDAERRIARTFVHELTHHWINDLNPRFANTELGRAPVGYWIVEGAATFFEEGIYDVDRGTWTLFDARAESVDALQALKKSGLLLPWKDFYAMGAGAFATLPRDAEAKPMVRRWHLGKQMVTPGHVFYFQASATVHFLYHAEGGAYRDRLLDYVTNYYTGKKDKLTTEAAFGLSSAELGKRVEDYADRVAAGWRP